MIRNSLVLVGLALSTALATGCDKAANQQHEADEARVDAEKKTAEAQQEAAVKINAARAEAEQKVAAAQAGFLKLREDYRHKTTEDLIEVDKDIAKLEASLKTAKGKAKAELTSRLPTVHTLRQNVTTEYESLERAEALNWDAAKARVDKAIADLKKVISQAE